MDSGDPFSSPTNRPAAALRAKRDATSAELLNSESSARIRQKAQAFSSQMEKASLERRLLSIESEKKELETRLTQKERLVAKLESDRRWLADREKEEREEKEEERREREEEKRQTTTVLRNLRVELSTLRDEHAELQEAHSTLKRTSTQTTNAQKSHLLELTRQVAVLEDELATAKQSADSHERNSRTLRAELEELAVDRVNTARHSTEGENWQIVRDELQRQVTFMRTLESTNAKLTGELASLRERHASIEVLREEKRDLERRARAADELRETVARVEAELDAARREREDWANEARTGESSERAPAVAESKTLANLRVTNALLQEEHGATKATLRRREVELEDAERRNAEAGTRISQLEDDAKELKVQVTRRERRLDLAEREVGFLKALVASFTAEESTAPVQDDTKLKRIHNLEETIDALKDENVKLEQEVASLGGGMRHGASWSDITRQLEEERARREQLERDITQIQTANENASEKIENLEQSLFELRGDIASGAHVPPNVRVLSMRENPLQEWTDLRQGMVDRLKDENTALLKRLETLEASGGGGLGGERLVPRESLEREHKEKCELEETVRQKEKRLLRLQQVFSSKAQEFREAMSSILGFKVHFFSNGQVKVTSLYDLNTSFVFQPTGKKEDDDDGTKMQLVGAGDSSLPDLARTVDYWVKQRMCIPGLMATVTLECYDKTKRGQAQACLIPATSAWRTRP